MPPFCSFFVTVRIFCCWSSSWSLSWAEDYKIASLFLFIFPKNVIHYLHISAQSRNPFFLKKHLQGCEMPLIIMWCQINCSLCILKKIDFFLLHCFLVEGCHILYQVKKLNLQHINKVGLTIYIWVYLILALNISDSSLEYALF